MIANNVTNLETKKKRACWLHFCDQISFRSQILFVALVTATRLCGRKFSTIERLRIYLIPCKRKKIYSLRLINLNC